MKHKFILFTACLLVLASCVVKALHPFYIKESISFDGRILGYWNDDDNGKWDISSFVNGVTKKSLDKMKKEDLKLYTNYIHSYYIKRTHNDTETLFLATPFVVNNQTFLDFFPLEHKNDLDNLLESHIVYAHSLVKYDVQKNGNIKIRWLDEDKIKSLLEENTLKLQHEKIGVLNEKYLLTAKSEELYQFIETYMNSNEPNKWETSTKFTLSKSVP